MTDPTSLPNFMPPTPNNGANNAPSNGAGTQGSVRDRVVQVLQQHNLSSRIDNDGDIEFTVNDQILFARVVENINGAPFALMRIFGQWQLQEPVSTDQMERLQRCNDMTLQLNLVSISLVEQSVVAFVEQVVTPSTELELLVPLSIDHILQGVGFFFQTWLPQDENGNPIVPGAGAEGGAPSGS